MKELIKPLELEQQYEAVESYCETRESCDWAWRGNGSPQEDEDILF
jgi:hypothetical protein